MVDLTPEGQRIVDDAARRYGISTDAVRDVLAALVRSGGGMAQFSHPDLGGMGQWSRGGMIMIGDMFNNNLKGRIDSLCNELSDVVGRSDIIRPASSQWQSQGGSGTMPLPSSSFFAPGPNSGNWWPADLGMPASTGSQNDMRYACFPDRQRLALDVNGRISVYDTGNHWISGFSQQQSGDQSATFTSQFGLVRVDSLPLVSTSDGSNTPGSFSNTGPSVSFSPSAPPPAQPQWNNPPPAQDYAQPPQSSSNGGADVFASIEKLAALRDKGILSEQEFAAKKSDLLSRL
jgi:hypothetical protein